MQDSIIEGYTPAPLAESARPMTFAEYAAWARTKRRPGSVNEDLQNSALGLAGEMGEIAQILSDVCFKDDEVLRSDLVDEAGDYLFYAFRAMDGWGLDPATALGEIHPDDLTTTRTIGVARKGSLLEFMGATGAVAEAVKKFIYHGKDICTADVGAAIRWAVETLATILSGIGITLAEALAANVRKLNHRYPSGFVAGGGIRN